MDESTSLPPEPADEPKPFDLMNDPSFDPEILGEEKSPDDPDTCRICRGEGSADEPLFYPCKCSGSIKFVHQDCLMEWLSHSQKKHCELCKTPFRFTKLYSPHMPRKLPTSVFIQKAIKHVFSHLLVWIRGLMVVVVWLIALPWCMRYAWRIVFWVGDAGWARNTFNDELMANLAGNTLPTSSSPNTSIAAIATSTQPSPKIPAYLNIKSQTLNLTLGEHGLVKLAKAGWQRVITSFRQTGVLPAEQYNSTVDPIMWKMAQQEQSSILSDIPFFKNLLATSPKANRVVMDVVEGQIITLSVVVAFILIFLIREWVVQQQPVADMGAADADNALAQAGGGAQNHAQDDQNAGDIALDEMEDGEHVDDEGSIESALFNEDARELQENDNAVTIDELRERIGSVEKIIDTLPEEVQIALRQGSVQEAVEKISKDEGAKAEQEVQSTSWAQAGNALRYREDTRDQDEPTSSRKELEELDILFPPTDPISIPSSSRPKLPSRERSFIATDIERSLEERVLDDQEVEVSGGSGNNDATEDEQLSQDSAGSWQEVSSPKEATESQETRAAALSDPAIQNSGPPAQGKGKERARSRSSQRDHHLSPSSASPSQHLIARSEAAETSDGEDRDDASWMSTVDSTESYIHDDLGMADNPFTTGDMDTPRALADLHDPIATPQGERSGPSDQQLAPAGRVTDRIFDFFWGDDTIAEAPAIAPGGAVVEDEDDEHIVEDLAAEAPFVRFAQAQPVPIGNQPNPAAAMIPPEVAAAAAQAGIDPNDPDAIEDAEDLEGILELIGMQGPIVGLFQNAIFSTVLIFLTVMGAVWAPYLYGKIVLLTTREPELLYKVPLRMGTMIADLVIDLTLILCGYVAYLFGQLFRWAMYPFSNGATSRSRYANIAAPALQMAHGAAGRLFGGASAAADLESKDFLYLSMECHAALDGIRYAFSSITNHFLASITGTLRFLFSMTPASIKELLLSQLPSTVTKYAAETYEEILSVAQNIWNTGSMSIQLGTTVSFPTDPMLAYWTARDRALAVIAGYSAVALIGALYLKIAPITTRWERTERQIMELFQQAGGVLKVILIISIEMIAFPLFCGFLLDVALMPLFESATFSSRFTFALGSPWTSGFVHWFVGTCYMFHFALFVSMCRRIMRSGVLYFIRDPDDPTFHPVRDVLERNVITQLRKIAFSAIVYGALIVVCLGGVVWSLWAVSDSVLPIHWTSTESSLEFPLDILFYNFLTPLIVKFARPSDGLHAMYTWWFRRCARALRLSDFLFRDNYPDEEGHHVRKTWRAWFTRKEGAIEEDSDSSDEDVEKKEDGEEPDVYFQRDGKHVRAPASDQVRIPKGSPVFVEVDENNHRLDGKPDDEGIHSKDSDMITNVYIPPWFRVRIGLFVVAVWLFAAATGISVTIVPLLFGRKVLYAAIPNANNVNDIYAFSLGIYVLGGLLYTALHHETITTWLRNTFWPSSASRTQAFLTLGSYIKRTVSVIYVYSLLAIGLPLLFAVLLELYILMPIHVSFGPEESHVVHLIQDWTLGILYVRIGTRILMWDRQSRAARAVQAVVRRGYLNPDARLATRAFILPTLLAFAVLLAAPFSFAFVANATYFRNAPDEEQVRVMRLAYPILLSCALGAWSITIVSKATERWRLRIRDEVYLIGERLHNFGDKKPGPSSNAAVTST
jgi:E3 ubiquitin-protein ligase MARCH6